MASIDSGVETETDSSDNSGLELQDAEINVENQVDAPMQADVPAAAVNLPDLVPSGSCEEDGASEDSTVSNNQSTAVVQHNPRCFALAIPSFFPLPGSAQCSTTMDKIDNKLPVSILGNRPTENPFLKKSDPYSGVEPPAGLSFQYVQPSLNFGHGYEMLSAPKCTLMLPYKQEEQQRKLRFSNRPSAQRNDPLVMGRKVKAMLAGLRLRTAASTNDVGRVRSLLEQGVDPTVSDEHKRTALHMAACKGYTEVVKLLLEYGANPNQTDGLGNTALHLAVCTSHVNVVTLLLRSGADVRLLDNYGRNPLQLAESKLKLLQKHNSYSSQQLQCEVMQVVEMIKTYLEKTGNDIEAELLSSFSARMTLTQSKEDVDQGLKELLANLSSLNLRK